MNPTIGSPSPQTAPVTLRRLVPAFVVTAILAVGGSVLWRGWSRMWDATVHPVRELGQITDATGLLFPPGCQVFDGRFHKTGGLGPSGLWAVVRVPAAQLQRFLKQPRLRNAEETRKPADIRDEFGWGVTLPRDAAQEQYKAQFWGVRRFAAAAGSEYEGDNDVEVVVDLDRPASPVAYVSWWAN